MLDEFVDIGKSLCSWWRQFDCIRRLSVMTVTVLCRASDIRLRPTWRHLLTGSCAWLLRHIATLSNQHISCWTTKNNKINTYHAIDHFHRPFWRPLFWCHHSFKMLFLYHAGLNTLINHYEVISLHSTQAVHVKLKLSIGCWLLNYSHYYITGCAVVQHCCKGDQPFQWENPKFDLPYITNPLIFLNQYLHRWLRPAYFLMCKIWWKSVHGGLPHE